MPVLSMELRGSGTQTDAIVLDSDDEAIAPIAVYNSTRATPAADNSDEDINDWVDSWYNHLLSPVPVPTERPAPVSNLQSNLSGLSLRETVPPERPTIPRGPNPFEGYDWSQAGNVPWVPPVNVRRARPADRGYALASGADI
ncbi:hypothetical protein PUNSTDRAFT_41060 [Punctularia strigosozonata HHB-11173 SS5]|uniref:uncharacterized protein n=1 Tax=Punctularia strigosozonata (strain HHB-11173) TaxID=741275 RepID=UPI0004417D58|nr:uncharacterized protein PUNSTDRAFT_41060 [Punctularia strigosozonata HHB-11173 SS5]EIN13494.1 hypothetical protein PUNSTDRAFT_41060 [Punctularia strigosozonata HHB-11173 SS5]